MTQELYAHMYKEGEGGRGRKGGREGGRKEKKKLNFF
jgi:hypothetical protein